MNPLLLDAGRLGNPAESPSGSRHKSTSGIAKSVVSPRPSSHRRSGLPLPQRVLPGRIAIAKSILKNGERLHVPSLCSRENRIVSYVLVRALRQLMVRCMIFVTGRGDSGLNSR